jgi:tol-pal system protein YbgF
VSYLPFVLCGLLATGCAGGGAHLKQENSTLQQTVTRLRAEARRDRHRIRDLENQVFVLKDRADTAQVQRGRTAGQEPELPVEVLEPEVGPAAETPRDYQMAGTADDGTEIIYMGDAAAERSVRPDTGVLVEDAPAPRRATPVREPVPESSDRIAVTGDVPTVDNQMKKAGVQRPAPAAERGAAPEDPREQYKRYYKALRAGNHGYAIAGFGNFLERYPKHDYADNAQYWLAEAYYDQKEYRTALTEFRKVVANFPDGNKAPDALLKLGYCYLALDRAGDARDVLEQVVRIYPKSNPAALAARKLETLPAD